MSTNDLPTRGEQGACAFVSFVLFCKTAWIGINLGLVLLLLLPGCQPNKEVQALLEPSQALGEVLAEEAVRLAGANRSITLITHDSSWGAPSTAEQALRAALKKQNATLDFVKAANLGNPMLSEVGLRAADFFEAMEKSAKAGAVISLVGAPLLKEGDAARLTSSHPPVLVAATASLGDKMGVHTDPVQLGSLLEAKLIQLAIIDGTDPTTQPTAKSDPHRALFAQHYHILRPAE